MTKHNNHPAQIKYREAKKTSDLADAAMDFCEFDDDNAAIVEAEFDAAWEAEAKAADELIKWAWTVIRNHPGAEQAQIVVDAALAWKQPQRAKLIDLAERMMA